MVSDVCEVPHPNQRIYLENSPVGYCIAAQMTITSRRGDHCFISTILGNFADLFCCVVTPDDVNFSRRIRVVKIP